MKLSKLRAGRLELAVCILTPLLLLACIAIPGHLYCRHLGQKLQERQASLEQVPEMERQLAAARQVLQPFAVASVEGDKASELTLTTEKAAQAFGFVTRAVNVEKPAGAGAEGWSDYKVMFNGAGNLKSIIEMLEFLELPAQRFQVSQMTLKAKGFVPEPTYDGSVVLTSRAISQAGAVGVGAGRILTAVQGAELTTRLGQLTAAVKSWVEEKRTPLAIALRSEPRREPVKVEEPRPTSLFVLNGIIRDKKNPLAMTDRGLFGVGDTVDGYKIISIADDQVMVQGDSGRQETVKLYSEKRPSDEKFQDIRDGSPRSEVQ
ncbi:MAG: hypothetical protein WCS01_06985 [bacterium]